MSVLIELPFTNRDEALDVAEELKLAANHGTDFDDVLWRLADVITDEAS